MTFLYLVPMVSSICSLLLAHDQWFFLRLFDKPDIQSLSNRILPSYFDTLFQRGAILVLAFLLTTISSSLAVMWSAEALLRNRGSWTWYLAGTLSAASHLAFAPFIFPQVRVIVTGVKENPLIGLRGWMRVHIIRSLTSDLAACVCFVVAVAYTIEP
ncbi:hypothetical protein F5Y13DRAFT_100752 [Hypoxylon sp. FL1857]|nr:hypothetical protein F5Y13DRAFT_100752 [Hypoxylon sp. FL1857]